MSDISASKEILVNKLSLKFEAEVEVVEEEKKDNIFTAPATLTLIRDPN